MTQEDDGDIGRRLAAVLNELDVGRAHVATSGFFSPGTDELVRERGAGVASLTFIGTPASLDSDAVRPLAERVLCVSGSPMSPLQLHAREEMEGWGGVSFTELPADYAAQLWTDIVRDHTGLVVRAIRDLTERVPAVATVGLPESEGVIRGVRYRIQGSGPPLLLFPIGLAATQWDAAIPELSESFTTIRLGGPHLGLVQVLEERAATGTYLQGVRSMFDLLGIGPGQRVLEVGIGSGAVIRDLAARPNAPAEIVAVDINEYLLDEARGLAAEMGEGASIDFRYGDAEGLPFDDNSFDVAYSVTVFEECDVDRGIAELHRVVKPGGRAGVIVRSDDLPNYWSINVPDEMRGKVNAPTAEQVTAVGCVDASLYPRFARHFVDVKPHPFWNSLPVGKGRAVIWADRLRATLDPAEVEAFDRALNEAHEVAFASKPHHSVVGVKPLK